MDEHYHEDMADLMREDTERLIARFEAEADGQDLARERRLERAVQADLDWLEVIR